jgi:hypothetical protein
MGDDGDIPDVLQHGTITSQQKNWPSQPVDQGYYSINASQGGFGTGPLPKTMEKPCIALGIDLIDLVAGKGDR